MNIRLVKRACGIIVRKNTLYYCAWLLLIVLTNQFNWILAQAEALPPPTVKQTNQTEPKPPFDEKTTDQEKTLNEEKKKGEEEKQDEGKKLGDEEKKGEKENQQDEGKKQNEENAGDTKPKQPLPGTPPVNQPLPGTPPAKQPLPGTPPVNQPLPGTPPVNQPLPSTPPINQPLPSTPPANQPSPGTPPVNQPLPAPPVIQKPISVESNRPSSGMGVERSMQSRQLEPPMQPVAPPIGDEFLTRRQQDANVGYSPRPQQPNASTGPLPYNAGRSTQVRESKKNMRLKTTNRNQMRQKNAPEIPSIPGEKTMAEEAIQRSQYERMLYEQSVMAGAYLKNNQGNLDQYLSENAKGMQKDYMDKLIKKEIGGFLNKMGKFKIGYSSNKSLGERVNSIDYMVTLAESFKEQYLVQASALKWDNRWMANVGFGYRLFELDYMWGGNLFFDQDLTSDHERISLGFEAANKQFRAKGNWYLPISSWKTISHPKVYDYIQASPASGIDLSLVGQLPIIPSMALTLQYFSWFGDAVDYVGINDDTTLDGLYKNPQGYKANISWQPVPLISGWLEYVKLFNGSLEEKRMGVALTFNLDEPLKNQFYSVRSPNARILQGMRDSFISRENKIILKRRKRPDPPSTVQLAYQVLVPENCMYVLNPIVNIYHQPISYSWQGGGVAFLNNDKIRNPIFDPKLLGQGKSTTLKVNVKDDLNIVWPSNEQVILVTEPSNIILSKYKDFKEEVTFFYQNISLESTTIYWKAVDGNKSQLEVIDFEWTDTSKILVDDNVKFPSINVKSPMGTYQLEIKAVLKNNVEFSHSFPVLIANDSDIRIDSDRTNIWAENDGIRLFIKVFSLDDNGKWVTADYVKTKITLQRSDVVGAIINAYYYVSRSEWITDKIEGIGNPGIFTVSVDVEYDGVPLGGTKTLDIHAYTPEVEKITLKGPKDGINIAPGYQTEAKVLYESRPSDLPDADPVTLDYQWTRTQDTTTNIVGNFKDQSGVLPFDIDPSDWPEDDKGNIASYKLSILKVHNKFTESKNVVSVEEDEANYSFVWTKSRSNDGNVLFNQENSLSSATVKLNPNDIYLLSKDIGGDTDHMGSDKNHYSFKAIIGDYDTIYMPVKDMLTVVLDEDDKSSGMNSYKVVLAGGQGEGEFEIDNRDMGYNYCNKAYMSIDTRSKKYPFRICYMRNIQLLRNDGTSIAYNDPPEKMAVGDTMVLPELTLDTIDGSDLRRIGDITVKIIDNPNFITCDATIIGANAQNTIVCYGAGTIKLEIKDTGFIFMANEMVNFSSANAVKIDWK